jgi:predicted  nucleic acid-binding Zn-ribbon protein
MPTLQCTSCGATYHTAAAPPHLALAPLMSGCQACGSREPLHIGVISESGEQDRLHDGGPRTRPPQATASGAG